MTQIAGGGKGGYVLCIIMTQCERKLIRDSPLTFNIFGGPRLEYIIKINFITFQTVDQDFDLFTLHEKLYFPSPGISWKTQKDQVNIIFLSTFWLKKELLPTSEKFKTKTFQ